MKNQEWRMPKLRRREETSRRYTGEVEAPPTPLPSKPRRRVLWLVVLLGGVLALIGALVLAAPEIGRTFALLTNTSYFTSDQINQGKRIARENRAVVSAVHAYQKSKGHWPPNLETLVPEFLPAETPLSRWSYHLKSPSVRIGVSGDHQFRLSYESDVGWLMAKDADTRPVRLCADP